MYPTILKKYPSWIRAGLLICVTFCLSQSLNAQGKAIRISHPNLEKVLVLEALSRIRVITVDGKRISGKFTIDADNSLIIKDQRVPLDQIVKIKRNPLLNSILVGGLLIYLGAATAVTGFTVGVLTAQPNLIWLALPGAALVVAGVKYPNFLKGYKLADGWKYEIIQQAPEVQIK